MNLKLRYAIYDDLEEINLWLEGWKKNPLPKKMYPSTGLILYDDDTGENIYAGFVWCSNSAMAQIGFITRNPKYKIKDKVEQTRLSFIGDLILFAKDLGYEYVITWAENKFLTEDFKKLGFITTSTKVHEMYKKI